MGNWEEFTAKTVSDALTDASVSFKVPSSMIVYEVIEGEKSGFFGFFGRQAKIRAKVKDEREENSFKEEIKNEIPKVVKPVPEEKKIVSSEQKEEVKETKTKDLNVDVEAVVKKFLSEVFKAMKIEAEIFVQYDKDNAAVDIKVEGTEMGILIGKRGQTLDSLQYLTSLIVNKETSSYLKVKLDTENYRERRKATLEGFAKNISYKVKKTKRPVALEPMNPYERRIIHSVLQGDRAVETHSEGEEPFRHVVVSLKKGYREYNSSRENYSKPYNNKKNNSRDKNYVREDNRYYKNELEEKENTTM